PSPQPEHNWASLPLMASSALSPSPPFSSLHHRQQRHLRTSASPSSLPAALFPSSASPMPTLTAAALPFSSSPPPPMLGRSTGVSWSGSKKYWRPTASTRRTASPYLPT
ncbi:unnamed protein product, partial [Musa banksii]